MCGIIETVEVELISSEWSGIGNIECDILDTIFRVNLETVRI